MKNYSLVVYVLIIFIGYTTSCAIRKSEPVKGRNFTTSNLHIIHGERLFMANCQKCHPSGESGLGPALNSSPIPQFLKRYQMRHGLGVMPSFSKNELTKKDLHDISKYLHAWKSY